MTRKERNDRAEVSMRAANKELALMYKADAKGDRTQALKHSDQCLAHLARFDEVMAQEIDVG